MAFLAVLLQQGSDVLAERHRRRVVGGGHVARDQHGADQEQPREHGAS